MVLLVLKVLGSHVLSLLLLLGELAGDLGQCFPVVTRLVSWVLEERTR